ncbi:MAG: endonuclease [Spirochaetes bacterium]|jgi:endonuclease-3 related protein|nr:endonuclease [Spirochaetota bacterium]
MISFGKIYRIFLGEYGRQGWWPIVNGKTFVCDYHALNTDPGKAFFEISIGAILTQNVAWKNVETAIGNLKRNRLLTPRKIHKARRSKIASLIRSSGYYNQKAIKIKAFIEWFSSYSFSYKRISERPEEDFRDELLAVRGIGPETADSILLYALKRKIFVVDAYTKRIFSRLGFFEASEDYHQVQKVFHRRFRGDVSDYNEFHALIVVHGKDVCKNKPLCGNCCIRQYCLKKINTA